MIMSWVGVRLRVKVPALMIMPALVIMSWVRVRLGVKVMVRVLVE